MAHDKDNEQTENENAETENAEVEAASTDEGETLLDAEAVSASDGSGYVDEDLDIALLEEELVEENRPTSSQNALEIKILKLSSKSIGKHNLLIQKLFIDTKIIY